MTQFFLTGETTLNTQIPTPLDTPKVVTNTETLYNKSELLATNNFPLCRQNGTCVDDDLNIPSDESDSNSNGYSLRQQLFKVTFESLYQNLASLPCVEDITNTKYVTRVFKVSNTETITIINDMRIKGSIVTTISGHTGYTKSLIRTITYERKKFIKREYSYGL